MSKIIHKDLSYKVRGVLIEVHNALGPMLPEKFYQAAIAIGLESKGLKCQVEKAFEVFYRQQRVGLYYVDLWVEDGKILLELKVAPEILPRHKAQAISYLKVTNADLAILANFGAKSLVDERLPNFVRDKVSNVSWEKRPVQVNLPFPELTNRLLEACYQVHLELGPGFLGQIYRRAVMIELRHQDINFEYIKKLPITYQGHQIGQQDVRLIFVEDKLLLAIVALKEIDTSIEAKLKTYLKHIGVGFGLLVNFYETTLQTVIVTV